MSRWLFKNPFKLDSFESDVEAFFHGFVWGLILVALGLGLFLV